MKVIPAVMVLVMREEERPNVGVVICEDGEEGRGEEGVTLPEGEMGEEGRRKEGGGRQGSIVCLPLLAGENCCLDHIAKFSH